MVQEDVDKIADSIKEFGMFHPIIVSPLQNGDTLTYKLQVGMKRALACVKLGHKEIEATITDETDPVRMEEMSLHENLKRANLEWWQEVKLVEAFHELQQLKHDKRKNRGVGKPKDGEAVWGQRDTARELERSLGSVNQDLKLARYVELHPSLKNVKDKRTAIKLARIEAHRMTAEEDALGATPAFLDDKLPYNELLEGDSLAILRMLPDVSFDACITDPPWLRFRDEATLEKDENTDKVFIEVYRLLKFNSFLYAVVGIDDWVYYRVFLKKLGFKVSKTPLIWRKQNHMSPVGVASWEYTRDFEFIMLAVKGSPALTTRTFRSSIFDFPIVPTKRMIHPHEKPVPLMQQIIRDCTFPGALVLEPFAGSGATVEACVNEKRPFVAIERDHQKFLDARKRLGLK